MKIMLYDFINPANTTCKKILHSVKIKHIFDQRNYGSKKCPLK